MIRMHQNQRDQKNHKSQSAHLIKCQSSRRLGNLGETFRQDEIRMTHFSPRVLLERSTPTLSATQDALVNTLLQVLNEEWIPSKLPRLAVSVELNSFLHERCYRWNDLGFLWRYPSCSSSTDKIKDSPAFFVKFVTCR
mmetsp:Transcript_10287/g.24653  ORF Transcript_10287/g.24653 Transcript_10287/m.24653 type:complete len:138 (+) Transcript_10287:2102-2515(+)